MRMLVRILAIVLLVASTHNVARAQTWPDRPIRFITSQAAGGGTDIICRIVAEHLLRAVGQQVIVENRPGGGNVIGTQAAVRSEPNGYNFFFATAAALVTDPYTFKSLPYNPMKDFVIVSKVAEVTFVILAHPSVKATTLPELFALAKAEPDKLLIATDGAIIARVNRELDAILKDPAVAGRMRDIGFITHGAGTLDEARGYVQAQYEAWGKVVREIGLQPE